MRSLIHLITDDDAVIPINYQHALSSALYAFIKDANLDLSSSLHHSKSFKFFNFSNIRFPRPAIKGPEVHLKKGTHVKFNFSSPASDILEATITGMLSKGKMEILGAEFTIKEIEILETPSFSTNATFSTLSPIHIDIVRENGERWDLVPTDPEWRQRIEENSRKKYSQYFGKEYRGPFEITDISRMKKKRINVGGQWWVSAHAEFTISAEPEMLRFLWDAGIGSKNSQGFGCVRYMDKEREMAQGKPFNTKSHG